MKNTKFLILNSILYLLSLTSAPLVAEGRDALGIAPIPPRAGPFMLLADRGEVVFYLDTDSLYSVSQTSVGGTYLIQHEMSSDGSRSMVNHIRIDCIRREIFKEKVEHWTGNWGDGELVVAEHLQGWKKRVRKGNIFKTIFKTVCQQLSMA